MARHQNNMRQGSVRCGLAVLGTAGHGPAWQVLARAPMERNRKFFAAVRGWTWHGEASLGEGVNGAGKKCGAVRPGIARPGKGRSG